jgi:hypothetical protein
MLLPLFGIPIDVSDTKIVSPPSVDTDEIPAVLLSHWLSHAEELADTVPETSQRVHNILLWLDRQQSIGPGQKALVDNGVLRSDSIYAMSGDLGRWFMNNVVRSSDTAAGRVDVYSHIEWLICEIESIYPLHDTVCSGMLDVQIHRLVQTLTNLLQAYPGSVVLEACLVRIRFLFSKDIHANT